jgi:hypothetical protein
MPANLQISELDAAQQTFDKSWVDLFLARNPSRLYFEEIKAGILESKKMGSSVLK